MKLVMMTTEYYMNTFMEHNLIGKINLNEYLAASGEVIYSHGYYTVYYS